MFCLVFYLGQWEGILGISYSVMAGSGTSDLFIFFYSLQTSSNQELELIAFNILTFNSIRSKSNQSVQVIPGEMGVK